MTDKLKEATDAFEKLSKTVDQLRRQQIEQKAYLMAAQQRRAEVEAEVAVALGITAGNPVPSPEQLEALIEQICVGLVAETSALLEKYKALTQPPADIKAVPMMGVGGGSTVFIGPQSGVAMKKEPISLDELLLRGSR